MGPRCARPRRRRYPALSAYRDPEFLATLAESPGPRHLDDDMEMVQDTFRVVRRQRRRPPRRARPPHQRRRSRGGHHRPCRARRLRALRPGRVRRFLRGRRQRVPGDGHRHRGAQQGEPRHRRVADHPAGDPHPCPRQGRHRGAEAALAATARQSRGDGGGGRHGTGFRQRRRRRSRRARCPLPVPTARRAM